MYRSEEEWNELSKNLKEIYMSERWSYYGGGKFHTKFQNLAHVELFESVMNPLLVANGTVAIELAIRAAFDNNCCDGRSIGIPVLTVPMVKWAAERSGCVDEIQCLDVDPKTFCIKDVPSDLDAVVWVHTGGLISKNTELMFRKCREDKVIIIEDISHAYGSSYNGRKAGTMGHFHAGSLFGTKVLTCGEGGIVGTHSRICYDFMKAMRNQGKNDNFEQIMDGYNYRASEFTAAIALARINGFNEEFEMRRKIANKYDVALNEIGIRSVEKELGCVTGLYKYIVRTKCAHKLDDRMENEGFSLTDWVHDKLLAKGNFPGAEEVADGHVCLQLVADPLKRNEYINTFKELWKEINR